MSIDTQQIIFSVQDLHRSYGKKEVLRGITLEKLKAAFCEGRDPYEPEAKDSCIREPKDPYKPIQGLDKRLAGTDHQWQKFWYPVMLYRSLLLVKTNFEILEF